MADILDLEVSGRWAEDEGFDELFGDAGIVKLKEKVTKRKGRGFTLEDKAAEKAKGPEHFEGLDGAGDSGPLGGGGVELPDDHNAQRSTGGWILFVTGIHDEAHEEDVVGRFCEFGKIKSLHLNLDRRTGFLKGYALIEFEQFKEAAAAKNAMDGATLLGNVIQVEWSFVKKSVQTNSGRRSRRN